MTEPYERAIVGLHDLFGTWMSEGRGDIGELDKALAPEFEMTSTEGTILPRSNVIQQIRGLKKQVPGIEFVISDIVPVAVSAEVCVVRYIEAQSTPAGYNERRATATFRANDAAPHGLEWVAVHETWTVPRAAGG